MSTKGEFSSRYSGEEMNEKMNDWKGNVISPADTYIEWMFENKCRQISDGFYIITEWRKRKQEYASIMKTIAIDFQHYSRHDVSHSVCILETIERLLGKQRVDLLSASDLWLLLEAAYSHDTGMAMTNEQMLNLWENNTEFSEFINKCLEDDLEDTSQAALYYKEADNLLHEKKKIKDLDGKEEITFLNSWPVTIQSYLHILMAEYIRKHHAQRVNDSFQTMNSEMETVIPPRLYQVVISVSQMHGKTFPDIFKELKYCTDGFGSGCLHPQFAAAMLRIGDLLDIDNNRFDPYAVRHFGRLPFASLNHMKKHAAITHICVSESEISAEADASEYEVALLTDEWFQMIQKEVMDLICSWNEIVPEALRGCVLKKSECKVFLNHQRFDSGMRKEFSINKKKIINLLIGANIYSDPLDCFREYLQNAMDASKMQLWMDLKNHKYDLQRNRRILNYDQLTPFDLDRSVYHNYRIAIMLQWNSSKDKIQVQIADQGIGIEGEYFEKLSNIGTGWRGREQYKEELPQMAKWLRPTGGFGIGIQSAFMVADFVDMVTKSDKDAKGYKVRLESPNKGGNISVEDYSNLYHHGTTITFEIEPEHFQGWMERLRRQDAKNIQFPGEKASYKYALETWDDFDADGILAYVQDFFENYIKAVIPNPLFPIEVGSTATEKRIYWSDTYWPDVNYWEQKEDTPWECDGRQYLRIWVEKKNFYSFLVWDKTDCILTRISNHGTDKLACFKNVVVRQKDDTLLNLFCRYSICMDFMGFHVENCLKLHRNSFHEKFQWEQYCYYAFKAYIHFLAEQYEKRKSAIEVTYQNAIEEEEQTLHALLENSKDDAEKQGLIYLKNHKIKRIQQEKTDSLQKDNIIKEWESYRIQLIRVIAFRDMLDSPYNARKDERNQIKMKKMVFDNNTDSALSLRKEDYDINGNEVLSSVHQYFAEMENPLSNQENEHCILLLDAGEEYVQEENNEIIIHPHTIQKWQAGEHPNPKTELILQTLINGIGIIEDTDTIKMLISDLKLYTKRCVIKNTNSNAIVFYCLLYKEKSAAISQQDFLDYFWHKSRLGRRYITGKSANRYPQLCVSELPFREKANRQSEVYLLSPISNYNLLNIQRLQTIGRKLSYDDFREYIWGKKGNESSEYHMLINWVKKHQVEENKYTRQAIIEAYEAFLTDLYMSHVYMP